MPTHASALVIQELTELNNAKFKISLINFKQRNVFNVVTVYGLTLNF